MALVVEVSWADHESYLCLYSILPLFWRVFLVLLCCAYGICFFFLCSSFSPSTSTLLLLSSLTVATTSLLHFLVLFYFFLTQHIASRIGGPRVLRQLISRGADLQACNTAGMGSLGYFEVQARSVYYISALPGAAVQGSHRCTVQPKQIIGGLLASCLRTGSTPMSQRRSVSPNRGLPGRIPPNGQV